MKRIEKKIIDDIIPKFISLQETYPSLIQTQIDYPSVKAWLRVIKNDGYDFMMMREIIEYIFRLLCKEKIEEATLLLLVSSATNDDLPMYILGRELYKGELFCENKIASFGIFTALMERDYAEAICDLAQFYRLGIVVKKDLKEATKLYKISFDAGVERAYTHYKELTQK